MKSDGNINYIDHHDNPATTSSTTDKKLANYEQRGTQVQDGADKKNEWKLAASVLDRICAIIFTVIFVAGTVVFFVIFAYHP